jgi:hypothetical protein
MEALACEKPVVSTQSGSRGIEKKSYKNRLFICADTDWEEFARQVARISAI